MINLLKNILKSFILISAIAFYVITPAITNNNEYIEENNISSEGTNYFIEYTVEEKAVEELRKYYNNDNEFAGCLKGTGGIFSVNIEDFEFYHYGGKHSAIGVNCQGELGMIHSHPSGTCELLLTDDVLSLKQNLGDRKQKLWAMMCNNDTLLVFDRYNWKIGRKVNMEVKNE